MVDDEVMVITAPLALDGGSSAPSGGYDFSSGADASREGSGATYIVLIGGGGGGGGGDSLVSEILYCWMAW
jgi:hypothetical protein